jgi:hypothetical protein
MGKKWMPITAGILDLIGGVLQAGFSTFVVVYLLYDMAGNRGGDNYVGGILIKSLSPFIIPGILAIIGGVFTLKRRRWKLTLVGSLMAFLPPVITIIATNASNFNDFTEDMVESIFFVIIPLILGITAPLLTILSRKQFQK